MAYTVPRVEIEQAFVQSPIFANNPLAAFIFGPNYRPLHYTEASEKIYTELGDYNVGTGIALTTYPWLTSHAGATVDISKDTTASTAGVYAHLTAYVEDAFACYYSDISSGAVLMNGGTYDSGRNAVASIGTGITDLFYTNQVQATELYFKTGTNPATGEVYTRTNIFSERDVQVGDWVAVTGTSGSGSASTIVFAQITAVTANADGEYNILQTAQRIYDVHGGSSATLLDPDIAAAISLYIRKSTVMPNDFILTTTTSVKTGVVLASAAGAKITETGLTDTEGVLVPLTIGVPSGVTLAPAKVYMSYRVLRTDNATQIASLDSSADVEAVLGVISPENPLAEGVYDAILNASGTSVYFMAVPTDNLAGYNIVLEQTKRTSAIYGMVPLTFDTTVQAAVKAHVNAMSEPAQAKWRKAWFCLPTVDWVILPTYDKAAVGNNWLTIGRSGTDPETGVEDVFITVQSDSGSIDPAFVTNGVRAADYLRVFGTDLDVGEGDSVTDYVDYEIAAVRSQNELVTTTAVPDAGDYITGRAVQIVRYYSNAEKIAVLGGASGNDRRVNYVFPSTCATAGVEKAGYFVAAALAGLRAGSLPHQPLTNVELLGFDDFTDTLVTYTSTELDELAAYGYWIIMQDTIGGVPYVRHQLTSAGYNDVGDDPKFSEDSLTTNVDSVSYGLQRALRPYIGKYNVNPGTVALVAGTINTQLHYQMLATSNSVAGPQLLGYNVISLGPSLIFRDRIEGKIELTLPYPLNKVTITLVVP